MNKLRYLITFLIISLSTSVFSDHLADDIEPGDGTNEIQLPLTKESAAELIRLESEGEVLSVDTRKHKNAIIFRVKVLHDNGKIKFYSLDPKTGHPPH